MRVGEARASCRGAIELEGHNRVGEAHARNETRELYFPVPVTWLKRTYFASCVHCILYSQMTL